MRRLLVYGALMAGTLVAGLVVRFAPLGLPWVLMKYGGSVMWALMVYWVCALVLARLPAVAVFLVAGVVATAVEFLKLVHTPGLEAFRGTLAGVLLLGRQFARADILAYWLAIGAGACVDAWLLERQRRGRA